MFIILLLLFYTRNFYVCTPPMSQLTLLPDGIRLWRGGIYFRRTLFSVYTLRALYNMVRSSSRRSRCTYISFLFFFLRILLILLLQPLEKKKLKLLPLYIQNIIFSAWRVWRLARPSVWLDGSFEGLSRWAGSGRWAAIIYIYSYLNMCVCVILNARCPWADFSSSIRRQQRWRGRFTLQHNSIYTGRSL